MERLLGLSLLLCAVASGFLVWPQQPAADNSCACNGTACLCCGRLGLRRVNVVCLDLVSRREDIQVGLQMDGEHMQTLSVGVTRAPDEFCFPTPMPALTICVRLYDVKVNGFNLHVCMDVTANVAGINVVILHFNCFNIGVGGVGVEQPAGGVIHQEGTNTYDPVTEAVKCR